MGPGHLALHVRRRPGASSFIGLPRVHSPGKLLQPQLFWLQRLTVGCSSRAISTSDEGGVAVAVAGAAAASRNPLARYAPSAPPIKSASAVPVSQLLDEPPSALPAVEQCSQADGSWQGALALPDGRERPPPDRPVEELEKVVRPPAGDGPTVIAGVEVPAKPERPGDEDCCMSGCAICVYDLFADALQEYNTAVRSAREALLASDVPRAEWPPQVREMDDKLRAREERAARRAADRAARERTALAEEGKAAERVQAPAQEEEEEDDSLEDLDPTQRAFIEFERKLKKKASGG